MSLLITVIHPLCG